MVNLIIDTEMCTDCDDAGAIILANRLMNMNEVKIIAVAQSTTTEDGIRCAGAINQTYGNPDIPLGKTTNKICKTFNICGNSGMCHKFNKAAADAYLGEGNSVNYGAAIPVLRKALVDADGPVTFVTLGSLANIYDLMISEPDEYSELTGMELIHAKTDKLVAMAGCFDGREGGNYVEWNVRLDIEAAREVADKFPAPVHYVGFENGDTVITGGVFKNLPENHVSRVCYAVHGSANGRCSWDLIAVLYAIRGACDLWEVQDGIKVRFTEEGCTRVTEGEGSAIVHPNANPKLVGERIDALLV